MKQDGWEGLRPNHDTLWKPSRIDYLFLIINYESKEDKHKKDRVWEIPVWKAKKLSQFSCWSDVEELADGDHLWKGHLGFGYYGWGKTKSWWGTV